MNSVMGNYNLISKFLIVMPMMWSRSAKDARTDGQK